MIQQVKRTSQVSTMAAEHGSSSIRVSSKRRQSDGGNEMADSPGRFLSPARTREPAVGPAVPTVGGPPTRFTGENMRAEAASPAAPSVDMIFRNAPTPTSTWLLSQGWIGSGLRVSNQRSPTTRCGSTSTTVPATLLRRVSTACPTTWRKAQAAYHQRTPQAQRPAQTTTTHQARQTRR